MVIFNLSSFQNPTLPKPPHTWDDLLAAEYSYLLFCIIQIPKITIKYKNLLSKTNNKDHEYDYFLDFN